MFTDFDEKFGKPFDRKGEPQKYLRLLIPFFKQDFVKKKDLLLMMGIDLTVTPNKKSSHSTMLAKLAHEEIIVGKQKSGTWVKGARFNEFMCWLTLKMLDNPSLKVKFSNLIVKWETNTIDWILKD